MPYGTLEAEIHTHTHTSTEGLLIKVWAQWQAHLLPRVSTESRISSTHTSSVSRSPAVLPLHPTPACHRHYQSKTKHRVPWQKSITGPVSCDSPLLFLVFHCVVVEKVCQSHRRGWFIGHCLIWQLHLPSRAHHFHFFSLLRFSPTLSFPPKKS